MKLDDPNVERGKLSHSPLVYPLGQVVQSAATTLPLAAIILSMFSPSPFATLAP